MFSAASSSTFSQCSTPSPTVSSTNKTHGGQLSLPKVVIITGAASGIGLCLAHHLLVSGDYKLILADISPSGADLARSLTKQYESSPPPIFVHADVSNWDDQVALFGAAFSAGNGNIDALIANAGIADSDDLLSPGTEEEQPPPPPRQHNPYSTSANNPPQPPPLQPPNLQTLQTNLTSIIYSIKLFTHHARHARPSLRKFIITSSLFALYPLPSQPLYTASKHALTGLVRAFAPPLLEQENIAINALCPAFVSTGLPPRGLVDSIRRVRPGAVTELGVVMRGFDRFLQDRDGEGGRSGGGDGDDDEGSAIAAVAGKVKKGKGSGKPLSGVICEISGNQLYDRNPVDYVNEDTRWLVEDPLQIWTRAYTSSGATGVK